MAVPSDKERLTRLETRATEADNALKQLMSYVKLLKSRAGNPNAAAEEAECQRIESENQQLSAEVEELKKKLVDLEIRNGPVQIPDPKALPPSHTSSAAAQQASSPPLSPPTPAPLPQNEAAKKTDGEKEKGGAGAAAGGGGRGKEKGKKKSGGGGGSGAADAPVDVSRLDFRIGRILSVEQHPDADTLYVEQIDIGEDKPRTVCSGLVKNIPMEELNNRIVVMLCNLKPAKMRGVVSEAMVMCASSPEKVETLDPPQGSNPGDRISFDGYSGTPDALLNPKKKVFEQIQPHFLVNEEGVATYRGIPFTIYGRGVCRVATMRGCGIK